MRAATVVQVLHGLFYVLLQLLVVAAIILSFIVSFIASFIVVVIPPLEPLVSYTDERCSSVSLLLLFSYFIQRLWNKVHQTV